MYSIWDPRWINIHGLCPAELLVALHTRQVQSQGDRARLYAIDGLATVEMAKRELRLPPNWRPYEMLDLFETQYPDYWLGKAIKVRLTQSGGRLMLEGANLYDRDAGPGACNEVVNQFRGDE